MVICMIFGFARRHSLALATGLAAGAVIGLGVSALAEPPGLPHSPVPQTPKTPPVKTDKPEIPKPTRPTPPTPPVTEPKDEPAGKDHPNRDTPDDAKTTGEDAKDPAYVLGFTVKRIDGTPEPLSDYRGKVVLIVNTASKCGYTPQYAGLQKLYEDEKDRGFVILGFPANNFGKQEPGSNDEIKEFCTSKFHVTFPMFEKVDVKGETASPLYKRLAAQPSPIGGEPKWNFTKFLVDRSGRVVARYEPSTTPEDKALRARIDALLAEKPADAGDKKDAGEAPAEKK
jgi:glutathione peroxidase